MLCAYAEPLIDDHIPARSVCMSSFQAMAQAYGSWNQIVYWVCLFRGDGHAANRAGIRLAAAATASHNSAQALLFTSRLRRKRLFSHRPRTCPRTSKSSQFAADYGSVGSARFHKACARKLIRGSTPARRFRRPPGQIRAEAAVTFLVAAHESSGSRVLQGTIGPRSNSLRH